MNTESNKWAATLGTYPGGSAIYLLGGRSRRIFATQAEAEAALVGIERPYGCRYDFNPRAVVV